MSNSTLTVASVVADKQQETAKTVYDETDPFKIIDDEGGYVEQQDLFDQPPTTKWELWSYYLYYNGVGIRYNIDAITEPYTKPDIRTMDTQSIASCHSFYNHSLTMADFTSKHQTSKDAIFRMHCGHVM